MDRRRGVYPRSFTLPSIQRGGSRPPMPEGPRGGPNPLHNMGLPNVMMSMRGRGGFSSRGTANRGLLPMPRELLTMPPHRFHGMQNIRPPTRSDSRGYHNRNMEQSYPAMHAYYPYEHEREHHEDALPATPPPTVTPVVPTSLPPPMHVPYNSPAPYPGSYPAQPILSPPPSYQQMSQPQSYSLQPSYLYPPPSFRSPMMYPSSAMYSVAPEGMYDYNSQIMSGNGTYQEAQSALPSQNEDEDSWDQTRYYQATLWESPTQGGGYAPPMQWVPAVEMGESHGWDVAQTQSVVYFNSSDPTLHQYAEVPMPYQYQEMQPEQNNYNCEGVENSEPPSYNQDVHHENDSFYSENFTEIKTANFESEPKSSSRLESIVECDEVSTLPKDDAAKHEDSQVESVFTIESQENWDEGDILHPIPETPQDSLSTDPAELTKKNGAEESNLIKSISTSSSSASKIDDLTEKLSKNNLQKQGVHAQGQRNNVRKVKDYPEPLNAGVEKELPHRKNVKQFYARHPFQPSHSQEAARMYYHGNIQTRFRYPPPHNERPLNYFHYSTMPPPHFPVNPTFKAYPHQPATNYCGQYDSNNFGYRRRFQRVYRSHDHNYNHTDQEVASSSSVNPPAEDSVDFQALNKRVAEQQQQKLEKMVPIVKDFYVEDPNVASLSSEDVQSFRDMKKLVVSIDKSSDDEVAIPNPISTFEESFNTFPQILGLLKNQGFPEPTPIQSQMWPCLMRGQDVIGIAQTGSGKTLAFLLPALIHIEKQTTKRHLRKSPTVLVIVPSRELVKQIDYEVQKFNCFSINSLCLYGGVSRGQQILSIKTKPDIVIATPGRLNDLVYNGHLDVSEVSFLILDEADAMLNQGFEPQIHKDLLKVRGDRQTVLTSATWPESVRRMSNSYTKDPVMVVVGTLDLRAVPSVKQNFVFLDEEDAKFQWILDFVKNLTPDRRTIIFVAAKPMVEHMAGEFSLVNVDCQTLHAELHQIDREQAMQDMHSSRTRILIATDLAARGIDISEVTDIVNYDFPASVQQYVHRIGRSGRAGCIGEAHTILSRKEWDIAGDLIEVLQHAKQEIPSMLQDMADRYQNRFTQGKGRGKGRGRGKARGKGANGETL